MGGGRRLDKREREQERREREREDNRARDRGLGALAEEGIRVFQTKDQREKETGEQKRAWGKPERLAWLKKGPGFRVKADKVTEEEANDSDSPYASKGAHGGKVEDL